MFSVPISALADVTDNRPIVRISAFQVVIKRGDKNT